MIVVSGALVLVALVLLLLGLRPDSLELVYASIVVSVLALAALAAGVWQRRGEPDPAISGRGEPTGPATPIGSAVDPHRSDGVPAPAEDPAPPVAVDEDPAAREDQAVPVVEDEVPPIAEDVDDELEYGGQVLVVRGRPRYHVEGCRYLAGRSVDAVDALDARDEGFTPCGVCVPDEVLRAEYERLQVPAEADPPQPDEPDAAHDRPAGRADEPDPDDSSADRPEAAVSAAADETYPDDRPDDGLASPQPRVTLPADQAQTDQDEMHERPVGEPLPDKPSGDRPEAEKPADEQPTDEVPVAEQPADEQPADTLPGAEEPADEQPADTLSEGQGAPDEAFDERADATADLTRETAEQETLEQQADAPPAVPAPAAAVRRARATSRRRRSAAEPPRAEEPTRPARTAPRATEASPRSGVSSIRPAPLRAPRAAAGAVSSGGGKRVVSVGARSAPPTASRETVVVAPQRDRFHKPECRFVRGVDGTRNLARDEAVQQFYRPCGTCRP